LRRVDNPDAGKRVEKESAELAEFGIGVAKLVRKLLPTHVARATQVEESVDEPGVDVEVHRALAQLLDRRCSTAAPSVRELNGTARLIAAASSPAYPLVLVPPQPRFIGEQGLPDVQARASGGIADVLVDRQSAVDQTQQLSSHDPQLPAFTARMATSERGHDRDQLLRLIHCTLSIDEDIRDAADARACTSGKPCSPMKARLWWDENQG